MVSFLHPDGWIHNSRSSYSKRMISLAFPTHFCQQCSTPSACCLVTFQRERRQGIGLAGSKIKLACFAHHFQQHRRLVGVAITLGQSEQFSNQRGKIMKQFPPCLLPHMFRFKCFFFVSWSRDGSPMSPTIGVPVQPEALFDVPTKGLCQTGLQYERSTRFCGTAGSVEFDTA